jgi:hypothetical protein
MGTALSVVLEFIVAYTKTYSPTMCSLKRERRTPRQNRYWPSQGSDVAPMTVRVYLQVNASICHTSQSCCLQHT